MPRCFSRSCMKTLCGRARVRRPTDVRTRPAARDNSDPGGTTVGGMPKCPTARASADAPGTNVGRPIVPTDPVGPSGVAGWTHGVGPTHRLGRGAQGVTVRITRSKWNAIRVRKAEAFTSPAESLATSRHMLFAAANPGFWISPGGSRALKPCALSALADFRTGAAGYHVDSCHDDRNTRPC